VKYIRTDKRITIDKQRKKEEIKTDFIKKL